MAWLRQYCDEFVIMCVCGWLGVYPDNNNNNNKFISYGANSTSKAPSKAPRPDGNDLKLGSVVVLDLCCSLLIWVQNVNGQGQGVRADLLLRRCTCSSYLLVIICRDYWKWNITVCRGCVQVAHHSAWQVNKHKVGTVTATTKTNNSRL